jgi:hypothetical protein
MEAHALKAPDGAHPVVEGGGAAEVTRATELVSIGAAFAVNCVSNLEKHLDAGRGLGIAEEEIKTVIDMAAFIKKMAASHVERLVGRDTQEGPQQEKAPCGCGC